MSVPLCAIFGIVHLKVCIWCCLQAGAVLWGLGLDQQFAKQFASIWVWGRLLNVCGITLLPEVGLSLPCPFQTHALTRPSLAACARWRWW